MKNEEENTKMYTLKDLEKELMKDPEFVKEYEKMRPEMECVKKNIENQEKENKYE